MVTVAHGASLFASKNKRFKIAENASRRGLVCSVCWGRGVTEVASEKWNYRYPAILSGIFVVLAFGTLLISGLNNQFNEYFDKVIVFVSTLIGSITGYYFAGSR